VSIVPILTGIIPGVMALIGIHNEDLCDLQITGNIKGAKKGLIDALII